MSKHDPLCEWATPCVHGENRQHSRDTENPSVPDASYCWMCGADCVCDLIAKVREDERANPACVCGIGDADSLAHVVGCPRGAMAYEHALKHGSSTNGTSVLNYDPAAKDNRP